ncbi:sugar transferase [Streptomyces sp. NPDC048362]|uniref:sugar transferase n=1 Tax=Streptomyces sp. NPDC048362 TaxID=3365539 RepID=UPI00371D1D69
MGLVAVSALVWPLIGCASRRYRASGWYTRGGTGVVARDWLLLVGSMAVLRTLLGLEDVPARALTTLLPALMSTLACREAIRLHQQAAQRKSRGLRRVLIIGEPQAVNAVVTRFAQRNDHPYEIAGACLVGAGEVVSNVPVVARLPAETPDKPEADALVVLGAAAELVADLAFVAPGRHLSGQRLTRLSWALHDRSRPLIVLTGVVDVSNHRLRTTSAAGVTLLHVSPPLRQGISATLKPVADRSGALLLVLLLSPLLLLLGLLVKLGSRGPALYRQTRVGRYNKPFAMWKFRTMVVDADKLKVNLEASNENDGHMFKMRGDPRVTRIGRILRRYSLDELPQLFNVLLGNMSLVGPRPPLPEEVAKYNRLEVRRLAVKPGLTGLWQVSGRSDLSWAETVELDLRYADNWSFTGDIALMARTLKAVLLGEGAY